MSFVVHDIFCNKTIHWHFCSGAVISSLVGFEPQAPLSRKWSKPRIGSGPKPLDHVSMVF